MNSDINDKGFIITKPTFNRLSGYKAWISSIFTTTILSKSYLTKQIKKNIGLECLMLKDLNLPQTYEPIPNRFFNKFKSIDNMEYLEECKTCIDYVKKFQHLSNGDESVFQFKGIFEYYCEYKSLKSTPNDVIEKLIEALNDNRFKGLNCVKQFNESEMREAAKISTDRYKTQSELSVLDGVPFFVKDCLYIKGYKTQFGCSYISEHISEETANCIDKLIKAGAILCGLNNMVPLGLNPVGYASKNGSFGITKNPYNTGYYVGGSSSGCASAAACGLCPFTIGTDAQGSVRIPSSFCGVTGFKPTFGRCSGHPSFSSSGICNTVGVIAVSPIDAFIPYCFMVDHDDNFMPSLIQPEIYPLKIYKNNLNSLKLGTDSSFTKLCSESVHKCYDLAIDQIKNSGCQIIENKLKNLMDSFAAMQVIISTDLAVVSDITKEPIGKLIKSDINVYVMEILKTSFTNSEVTQSLKQRTKCMEMFDILFKSVDLLITPTVAVTCEKIEPDDEYCSVLSEQSITEHMRFVFLANLTGCPAITINCGYTDNGLPVGLQLMAPWYKEDLLVNVACLLQTLFDKRIKPQIYVDLIPKIN